MTSKYAWVRRLDFRYDEVMCYMTAYADKGHPYLQEAAVDHARALWSIAQRMTAYDRADVLELRGQTK